MVEIRDFKAKIMAIGTKELKIKKTSCVYVFFSIIFNENKSVRARVKKIDSW